ncbi:MAG: succinyl-diaminopimelate desuccinylase [Parvibaculales bacterium]
MSIDAVAFAAELIRCPSVTPEDAGALDVLQAALEKLGFACTRLPFEEDGTAPVDNLYARLGTQGPHLCFAGHTDVVPVGAADDWQVDPFAGEIRDQALWGRGAADMKGSIAAFVAAIAAYIEANGAPDGSISLLITGDEEGPSINGTRKMLGWLQQQNEIIDDCIVGEPTNPDVLGDMIKIGRRGSVNGVVTVTGTQGHVAYPHLAENPVPQLTAMMTHLAQTPLDEGSTHFQPSNLELTGFDVGNMTTNVIPAQAVARFNIRYNDHWTAQTVSEWIGARLDESAGVSGYQLDLSHTGDCFLTEPGPFVEQLSAAIEEVTGRMPQLSTTGGTSDARFIKDICRVVEFGLVGKTMHKVDERVPVDDIRQLVEIYRLVLNSYFAV